MLQWCENGNGGGAGTPCAFSILFPVSGKQAAGEAEVVGAATSSVDCTLSLGMPYARHDSSTLSSSVMYQSPSFSTKKPSAPASSRGGARLNDGDPLLLARRCANCDTTSTPLWRNGPRGPKSLCNACGIRYKKEERRAAASTTNSAMAAPRGQQSHPWGCYTPATAAAATTAKNSAISMYCEEAEEHGEMYLQWRLNVVPPHFTAGERGGIFQYQ